MRFWCLLLLFFIGEIWAGQHVVDNVEPLRRAYSLVDEYRQVSLDGVSRELESKSILNELRSLCRFYISNQNECVCSKFLANPKVALCPEFGSESSKVN